MMRIAMLALVFVAGAHAADFPPPPSDPKLAEAYQQARATLAKASAAGYLDMPADAKPWPCAVTELELRRYVHLLTEEEQDEKTRRRMARMYADLGSSAKGQKNTIRDVRYAPIVAGCKDGKLDGPLEFVMEYGRTLEMPAMVSENRARTRYQLTLVGGEPSGQAAAHAATINLSSSIRFKDAAMQAIMDKNKAPPARQTFTASYTGSWERDAGYSVIIMQLPTGTGFEWNTMMTRPIGPARTETTSYQGDVPATLMTMKNGRMHGEMRSFARTMGTVSIPASVKCYEDGEEIKTTGKCNAD